MSLSFIKLPAQALELSHNELRVYGGLQTFCINTTYCWPSLDTLSKSIGMSRRVLQLTLKQLEALELVEIRQSSYLSLQYHLKPICEPENASECFIIVDRQIVRDDQLSHRAFKLYCYLNYNYSCLEDIAEFLGTSKSTTIRLCNRLLKSGLIIKDNLQDDNRRTVFKPTSKITKIGVKNELLVNKLGDKIELQNAEIDVKNNELSIKFNKLGVKNDKIGVKNVLLNRTRSRTRSIYIPEPNLKSDFKVISKIKQKEDLEMKFNKPTDDEIEDLCLFLAEKIKDHMRMPFNPVITDRWRKDMRLFCERGALHQSEQFYISPENAKKFIEIVFMLLSTKVNRFCWADQIRSPYALRDHFWQIRSSLNSSEYGAILESKRAQRWFKEMRAGSRVLTYDQWLRENIDLMFETQEEAI